MRKQHSQDDEQRWIDWSLAQPRRIAVVGLSDKPDRDSYRASLYLQQQGYDIVPVNPNHPSIMGRPCYGSLYDIPGQIDIVNLFQRVERVPKSVEAASAIGASLVWMQLDIIHIEAAVRARRAGLGVVMDRCIKIEHELRHRAGLSITDHPNTREEPSG